MVKEGWYLCPYCGHPMFKVRHGTRVSKVVMACDGCGKEHEVSV